MSDYRTVYDFSSEEEYQRYEDGEDGFDDVTENTIEAELEMMFDADEY